MQQGLPSHSLVRPSTKAYSSNYKWLGPTCPPTAENHIENVVHGENNADEASNEFGQTQSPARRSYPPALQPEKQPPGHASDHAGDAEIHKLNVNTPHFHTGILPHPTSLSIIFPLHPKDFSKSDDRRNEQESFLRDVALISRKTRRQTCTMKSCTYMKRSRQTSSESMLTKFSIHLSGIGVISSCDDREGRL